MATIEKMHSFIFLETHFCVIFLIFNSYIVIKCSTNTFFKHKM